MYELVYFMYTVCTVLYDKYKLNYKILLKNLMPVPMIMIMIKYFCIE